MRLPAESASSWVHLAFASFTYASHVAWAEAELLAASSRAVLVDLAALVKASMERLLKEARETQDAMIFARPHAQARQNVALNALKRTTKEALQLTTIRLGAGSENHPHVRFFLPKLLSGVTKLPIDERPGAVTDAAGRLDGLPAFDEKEQLVLRLKEAALHAQRMIDEADSAFDGWKTERSEEVMAKGQMRLDLQSVYGGLRQEFPGQRDFFESFFLRAGKPSEGRGDGDE